MPLCDKNLVKRIAEYLEIPDIEKIPVANLNEKDPIIYFSTVIQVLLKTSKHQKLFGFSKEIQALTRQWLEYITICVNHADVPIHAKRVLKELNAVFRDNTYVTGTTKTIADVALYYILYEIVKKLSFQEKTDYIHVTRWFDYIQQEDRLRQNLDLISFKLFCIIAH